MGGTGSLVVNRVVPPVINGNLERNCTFHRYLVGIVEDGYIGNIVIDPLYPGPYGMIRRA